MSADGAGSFVDGEVKPFRNVVKRYWTEQEVRKLTIGVSLVFFRTKSSGVLLINMV